MEDNGECGARGPVYFRSGITFTAAMAYLGGTLWTKPVLLVILQMDTRSP